jgi:hypothetical protein
MQYVKPAVTDVQDIEALTSEARALFILAHQLLGAVRQLHGEPSESEVVAYLGRLPAKRTTALLCAAYDGDRRLALVRTLVQKNLSERNGRASAPQTKI